MAKQKRMDYQILRDHKPRPRRWPYLAAGAGVVAAAFLAAFVWQGVQLRATAKNSAFLADKALPAAVTEIQSDGAGELRRNAASLGEGKVLPAGGQKSKGDAQAPDASSKAQPDTAPTSEPGGEKESYQVPKSDPVDESYFDDALFVGDSITTGISLYQTMANATVVASTGINPATILTKPVIRDKNGALHTVLQTMQAYTPKKIYVMLGANGVGWIEKEDFIENYQNLIRAIMAQHPDAILYIQSIFPVTKEKSLSENGIFANDKIVDYNRAIAAMCKENGVYYLNVAQAVADENGALATEASPDGIHIGPDYYRKWFDYLKTHTVALEEAVGGTKTKEKK